MAMLSSSKMKNRLIISIIGLAALQMMSCKSFPMKMEDFTYKQIIRDSILIVSNTANPSIFVYGEFESILFKVILSFFEGQNVKSAQQEWLHHQVNQRYLTFQF